MGRATMAERLLGRRGFTLIELMIASVTMSIGLFAIIHLQVVVVRGNNYSRELSEANELADATIEYLRIQALAWLDTSAGTNPLITTVPYFSTFNIAAPPAASGDFADATVLRALQELSINNDVSPVAIATGPAPVNALRLTSAGLPETLAPNAMDGLRALYRIHYVAYPSRLTPTGQPSNDLITVLVFVSWDNKDHGRQEQSWDDAAWYTDGSFFQRHMVVRRILLSPRRTW